MLDPTGVGIRPGEVSNLREAWKRQIPHDEMAGEERSICGEAGEQRGLGVTAKSVSIKPQDAERTVRPH